MNATLVWMQRVESLVAAVAYALVAGLLLGEIVARELLTSSIWGSQKMAVFASIMAGFIGLTLTTGTNGHLRPQFADRWLPLAWDGNLNRLGDLLSCLIYVALAVISLGYVSETRANGDQAAVLYWTLWPLQMILPYAFLSAGIKHLIFAVRPDLKPEPSLMDA